MHAGIKKIDSRSKDRKCHHLHANLPAKTALTFLSNPLYFFFLHWQISESASYQRYVLTRMYLILVILFLVIWYAFPGHIREKNVRTVTTGNNAKTQSHADIKPQHHASIAKQFSQSF